MAEFSQERRNFIKTVSLVIGAAALLWRYLTPTRLQKQEAPLRIPLAEIPVDGAYVDKDARVAVIRDKEMLYAIDLSCTHLGCRVNVNEIDIVCPCHGSRFNLRGEVLQGPATKTLKRLEIRENSGMIEVFRS